MSNEFAKNSNKIRLTYVYYIYNVIYALVGIYTSSIYTERCIDVAMTTDKKCNKYVKRLTRISFNQPKYKDLSKKKKKVAKNVTTVKL